MLKTSAAKARGAQSERARDREREWGRGKQYIRDGVGEEKTVADRGEMR